MKTNPGWHLKNICWALLLVALPFTSFPILASLLGGTAVAPLSALFLFVLMLAAYLPDVLKHRSIPRQALPLILFLLAAIFLPRWRIFSRLSLSAEPQYGKTRWKVF